MGRVLCEKQTVPLAVKNFTPFYIIRSFITRWTTAGRFSIP